MHRRKLLGAGCSGWGVVALSACTWHADVDHDGPDAPRPDNAPPAANTQRRARTLVLGSGGPRGYVHVGVLKGLDELGLRPDFVVGASVGALIGALYASGMSAAAIETLALDLSPLALARLAVGATEKLDGSALAHWVRQQTGHTVIERLPTAFAAISLERRSRHAVAFTAGDLGLAVQASTAIEGLYTPVRLRGTEYVDPDASAPLPVRQARQLGARQVVAVDASAHEERAPAGAERYRDSDRAKRAATAPDAAQADLYLHPDFGYWISARREYRLRAIAAGRADTLAAASRLRELWSRA